jgi:hypothetical protein
MIYFKLFLRLIIKIIFVIPITVILLIMLSIGLLVRFKYWLYDDIEDDWDENINELVIQDIKKELKDFYTKI